MKFRELISDQLYAWSDKDTEPSRGRLTKTPPSAPAPTAPAQSGPPWFPHRTLQTLWQARMQVRRRPRPWSQILSVGELSRPAPANGLRPARVLRAGERVPGPLPPRPPDLGGDLRDQPRAPTPSREAFRDRHERSALSPPRADRSGTGRRAPRQYARQLARPRPQLDGSRGGQG
jgi:hypothetical protein